MSVAVGVPAVMGKEPFLRHEVGPAVAVHVHRELAVVVRLRSAGLGAVA